MIASSFSYAVKLSQFDSYKTRSSLSHAYPSLFIRSLNLLGLYVKFTFFNPLSPTWMICLFSPNDSCQVASTYSPSGRFLMVKRPCVGDGKEGMIHHENKCAHPAVIIASQLDWTFLVAEPLQTIRRAGGLGDVERAVFL